MAVLEIDNLTYSYPTALQPALKQLSLNVGEGECIAIAGANLSGKTTLCYALSGIIPHYYPGTFAGSVRVNGIETTGQSLSELSRQVGLVMQHPLHQLSGMRFTVFEEVAFGLENLGVARECIEEQVNAALSLVDLTEKAARSPYHLSGGQQQRLAIAAILAVSPKILILDEPTTFLDPQGTRIVLEILLKLKQNGTTIVLAEQNMEWLAEHADRVIVLKNGEIQLQGKPSDVLASTRILESGIDWLRFTKAGYSGRRHNLWPDSLPLPVTLHQAAAGFSHLLRDEPHADND